MGTTAVSTSFKTFGNARIRRGINRSRRRSVLSGGGGYDEDSSSSLKQRQQQQQLVQNESRASNAATTTAANIQKPRRRGYPFFLGPPEHLQNLPMGQYLTGFRTKKMACDISHDNYDDTASNVISTNNTVNISVSNNNNTPRNHTEGAVVITDQLSNFTIERASYSPNIFIFRNLLTPLECSILQSTAQDLGMTRAETINPNDYSSRKNCTVAWIPPASTGGGNNDDDDDDDSSSSSNRLHQLSRSIVSSLSSCTARILLSPNILSNPSAGAEDLQVLHYGTRGEFVLHHDGEPRVVTVIYYLNGVGGTWFPLASRNSTTTTRMADTDHDRGDANDNNDDDDMIQNADPENKVQAMEWVRDGGYQPGRDGLLVQGMGNGGGDHAEQHHHQHEEEEEEENHSSNSSTDAGGVVWVRQGDAVAFYNYRHDPLLPLLDHPHNGSDGQQMDGKNQNGGDEYGQHSHDCQHTSTSSSSSSTDHHHDDTGSADGLSCYDYPATAAVYPNRLDWRAIHCGLSVSTKEKEKWIANHWFRLNDLLAPAGGGTTRTTRAAGGGPQQHNQQE